MKICMLAYTFYETDTRVMMYAESIAARGDQVDVICVRREGNPCHEVLKSVNVFRIQKREVNEKSKWSYFMRIVGFFVISSIFLTKRFVKVGYDVIHVHSVPDFEVFAAIIPKIFGARIILDIHDLVPELYANKFKVSKGSLIYKALIMIERLSNGFADHVIIANHLWKKTLSDRSIRNGKCSVFLNYPNSSIFYERKNVVKGGNIKMIYPGTLNRHQGVDIAVKAFKIIQDEVAEAEFHIYGEGPEKPMLQELVSKFGLDRRVLFKSFLSIDKIAKVMAESDIGIVPKRNDGFGGEAFSTKILEFMALGIPVIVSATKIDRYYFNDSVVMFFNPEDMKDLADKMLLLIKNREIRERLAENALYFASSYSWDKKKQEYFDLVDSLVRKGKNHLGSFCKSDVV